jgi:hypothetical protein
MFTKLPMSINFRPQRVVRSAALAVLALACCAATAAGGSPDPDARARYQSEKAACLSGQSHQDRATCLKEAGAALAESRTRKPIPEQANYEQHALIRCNALPADDRVACQRRIQGEGSSSGSVEGGGLIRTIVTPVPAASDSAAPDPAAPAEQGQQPPQPPQQ